MGIPVSSKKKSTPIPDGVYQAVTIGVIDLGTQYDAKWDKHDKKVMLMWEIPELRIKFEKEGKEIDGAIVRSKTYTQSIGQKSNLYKDLTSWRGKAFTKEELMEFSVEKLMGVNCMLQIINTVSDKDGQTYSNISAVLPLYKGVPQIKPEINTFYFSFTDDMEVPDNIPEWIKEKISKAEEWKEREEKLMGVVKTEAPNAEVVDDVPPF
jgi:hypothetical protein